MEVEESLSEERRQKWLQLALGQSPEWMADLVESSDSRWVVVIEEGPDNDRVRHTACLTDPADLPYWAFALAKAYLDDVGEWPLSGFMVEAALSALEEHGNPERAVREIIAAIHPVWPDVTVLHVGEEMGEMM